MGAGIAGLSDFRGQPLWLEAPAVRRTQYNHQVKVNCRCRNITDLFGIEFGASGSMRSKLEYQIT